MSSIAVITSQSNFIRAQAAARPGLTPRQLARELGIDPRIAEVALQKGDKRRRKSIAK